MVQSQSPANVKYSVLKKITIVILAIWLVLYLCIWAFSPMAVRYFAAQPLSDINLQLDGNSSVRFNPFTSTLSLDNVILLDESAKQVFTLAEGEISIHLHRLLVSELYVSKFTVSQVTLDILKQKEALFVAGIDLNAPTAPAEDSPEPATTEEPSSIDIILPVLTFSDLNVNAQIDGHAQTIVLNQLSITDGFVNQHKQSLQLALMANINDAPFTFESTVALENKTGDISSNISLNNFSLASISPLLAQQAIEVSGLLSVQASPQIKLSADSISVNDKKLTVGLNDLFVSAQSMLIEGKTNTIIAEDLAIIAATSGNLQSASVNVTSEFTQGQVGIERKENNVLNWGSIAALTQIEVSSGENGELIPRIVMPSLSFDTLHLSEDFTLEVPVPILALGKLNISALEFANNQLVIDKIQIAGLKANLQMNVDKSIQSLVDTSALTPTVSEPEIPATEAQTALPPKAHSEAALVETKAPLTIVLNTFELLDKGFIQVKDATVKPVFMQELTVETLTAGPFDSSKPSAQTPFALLLIDPNYLKIDAKGYLTPFADKLSAEVIAKVAELNLPSVSPYVKDGLGFEMKTGQLDVTIKVNIDNDKIKGNTHLFLRGIEMASANEVEQGVMKEGKAMPLNIALGMLKDSDGNIDLDVPMRGNVAEPSFGIESFVTLIIKKAVMSQAKDYLLKTFVPYASVVSVALSGAEFLLKISFEPLTFDVGEAALKADNAQFLSELALLMQDTPDLQIKTCAIVTYADLGLTKGDLLSEQQKAQLKTLGDERQAKLKRFLVDKGLASNRVLYCAPELGTGANALPRIELKTD